MECSWNNGSETKYYVVIFDQLQGHSRGLIQASESFVRGPLTFTSPKVAVPQSNGLDLKRALKSVWQMYLRAARCFR